MAMENAKLISNIEPCTNTLQDMPGDADDFLAKLTSAPSPVHSEFSDYGSMPRSPASESGECLLTLKCCILCWLLQSQ